MFKVPTKEPHPMNAVVPRPTPSKPTRTAVVRDLFGAAPDVHRLPMRLIDPSLTRDVLETPHDVELASALLASGYPLTEIARRRTWREATSQGLPMMLAASAVAAAGFPYAVYALGVGFGSTMSFADYSSTTSAPLFYNWAAAGLLILAVVATVVLRFLAVKESPLAEHVEEVVPGGEALGLLKRADAAAAHIRALAADVSQAQVWDEARGEWEQVRDTLVQVEEIRTAGTGADELVKAQVGVVLAEVTTHVEALEDYGRRLDVLNESITSPARADAAREALVRLDRLRQVNAAPTALGKSADAVAEAQQAVDRL